MEPARTFSRCFMRSTRARALVPRGRPETPQAVCLVETSRDAGLLREPEWFLASTLFWTRSLPNEGSSRKSGVHLLQYFLN